MLPLSILSDGVLDDDLLAVRQRSQVCIVDDDAAISIRTFLDDRPIVTPIAAAMTTLTGRPDIRLLQNLDDLRFLVLVSIGHEGADLRALQEIRVHGWQRMTDRPSLIEVTKVSRHST